MSEEDKLDWFGGWINKYLDDDSICVYNSCMFCNGQWRNFSGIYPSTVIPEFDAHKQLRCYGARMYISGTLSIISKRISNRTKRKSI